MAFFTSLLFSPLAYACRLGLLHFFLPLFLHVLPHGSPSLWARALLEPIEARGLAHHPGSACPWHRGRVMADAPLGGADAALALPRAPGLQALQVLRWPFAPLLVAPPRPAPLSAPPSPSLLSAPLLAPSLSRCGPPRGPRRARSFAAAVRRLLLRRFARCLGGAAAA